MKIGMIGLGRMGSAVGKRLVDAGYQVLGYDPSQESQDIARAYGIIICDTIEQAVLDTTITWLMVPAGALVDTVINSITPHVKAGHIIVDGGNSKFTDSIRRAELLVLEGIMFVDCGTSGGVHGKENGFCLMLGGNRNAYHAIEPLCIAISAPHGFGYMGPSGAGHYVKMIHNGIEYGLLQAYAEGFELLREGEYKNLDLAEIARVWDHGSVIRSWLLELSRTIFEKDQRLASIRGDIEEGGTGAWTLETARKHNIPMPVLEQSLEVRKASRETGGSFATKVIALLRNTFGGHSYKVK